MSPAGGTHPWHQAPCRPSWSVVAIGPWKSKGFGPGRPADAVLFPWRTLIPGLHWWRALRACAFRRDGLRIALNLGLSACHWERNHGQFRISLERCHTEQHEARRRDVCVGRRRNPNHRHSGNNLGRDATSMGVDWRKASRISAGKRETEIGVLYVEWRPVQRAAISRLEPWRPVTAACARESGKGMGRRPVVSGGRSRRWR